MEASGALAGVRATARGCERSHERASERAAAARVRAGFPGSRRGLEGAIDHTRKAAAAALAHTGAHGYTTSRTCCPTCCSSLRRHTPARPSGLEGELVFEKGGALLRGFLAPSTWKPRTKRTRNSERDFGIQPKLQRNALVLWGFRRRGRISWTFGQRRKPSKGGFRRPICTYISDLGDGSLGGRRRVTNHQFDSIKLRIIIPYSEGIPFV